MLKRAWLNISRKKSKTILLMLILFIIANLVLASLIIKSASDKQIEFAKKSLGSEVSLSTDMESLRNEKDSHESKTDKTALERPKIYLDTVNKIGESDYVKDYSYSITTFANLSEDLEVVSTTSESEENNKFSFKNEMKNLGDVSIEGVVSYSYLSEVENNTMTITEGKYIDDSTDNKIMVSYDFASQNELKVGDKITLINTSTEKEIKLTIYGIYDISSEDDNNMMISSSNKIIMNVNTASKFLSEDEYNDGNYSVNNVIYYLNNPEDSDSFILQTNNMYPELSENNLSLSINNQLYESMVGPIESVGSFATTILIVVMIASIFIISLIIFIQIKERKYEIGVLMSLGEKKIHIIIQFIFELFIITTISFILSIGTSYFVAKKMGSSLLKSQLEMNNNQVENNFGRPGAMGEKNNGSNKVEVISELDISVNIKDYIILFSLGYLIVVGSMVLPSVSIMKYEPKTILTRRDS